MDLERIGREKKYTEKSKKSLRNSLVWKKKKTVRIEVE